MLRSGLVDGRSDTSSRWGPERLLKSLRFNCGGQECLSAAYSTEPRTMYRSIGSCRSHYPGSHRTLPI